jgi:hypothetical protein
MLCESPDCSDCCYTNAAAFTYTTIIQVVIVFAGALMIYRGGRVLRGVILLLIGAVIIPLSGMQEWELSLQDEGYLTQPIPLEGIIPIALALGVAYVVSTIAEPIIRILAALMFWSCKALFWPPIYNFSCFVCRWAERHSASESSVPRPSAWWGSE